MRFESSSWTISESTLTIYLEQFVTIIRFHTPLGCGLQKLSLVSVAQRGFHTYQGQSCGHFNLVINDTLDILTDIHKYNFQKIFNFQIRELCMYFTLHSKQQFCSDCKAVAFLNNPTTMLIVIVYQCPGRSSDMKLHNVYNKDFSIMDNKFC